VIVYDPLLSDGQKLSTRLGWNNYATLNQGTIDTFKHASRNQLWFDIVDTTVVTSGWPVLADGFQYTEATYLAVMNHQIPPPSNAMVNYNAIVNSPQFDICGKANRHEIDEVWIFNGPYFGFYESTLVGPGAYPFNSPPVPGPYTCNRLVPIMGPSPERGVAEEVHNFGHRTESTMTKVYGSWQQNSTAHNWDKFALVKVQSPSFSYSGCGDTHYPPNGANDYDYSNPSIVMSNCNDFANYPNLHDPATVLQPVSCTAWSCSPDPHLSFLDYWFGHLPSNSGCGSDNVANNWLLYVADPGLALNPAAACPTMVASLSINFTTGKPGSFFTLSGRNYPPNSTAALNINDLDLGTTNIDSAGSFIFVLSTSSADTGGYIVTITANPGGTRAYESGYTTPFATGSNLRALFILDNGAPLRPQIDAGILITVPSGISFTPHTTFLPAVLR
jgi:hypothetical protein